MPNRARKDTMITATAGALTIAQFVLIFFFSIHGVLAIRILGYLVWVLTAVLGWLPFFTLRRQGGVGKGKSYIYTSKLVTTGIYSVVRHPQYLAMPLVNIGLMMISQHWLIIILGVLATILFYLDIRTADAGCIEKFGDEYRRYQAEVPGFNIIAGIWRKLKRRWK